MYNYTNRYFNRFRAIGENLNNADWPKNRVDGVAPVPAIDTATRDLMCMSILEYDNGRYNHGITKTRTSEHTREQGRGWRARNKQAIQDERKAIRLANAKQDAFDDMLEDWEAEIASRI